VLRVALAGALALGTIAGSAAIVLGGQVATETPAGQGPALRYRPCVDLLSNLAATQPAHPAPRDEQRRSREPGEASHQRDGMGQPKA